VPEGYAVKLSEIVGYRLDMARCAALRSLHRLLDDCEYRPADTTALLLIREQPGCDQATLGRALAGNRSVGMKLAARLEARGLLIRGEGRDRRSKGLYITPEGEAVLRHLMERHREAERRLAAALDAGEREQLLRLLDKIERGVLHEEADLTANSSALGQNRHTGPSGLPNTDRVAADLRS
jgi:DNA-binding MarR family transcriptional regulator